MWPAVKNSPHVWQSTLFLPSRRTLIAPVLELSRVYSRHPTTRILCILCRSLRLVRRRCRTPHFRPGWALPLLPGMLRVSYVFYTSVRALAEHLGLVSYSRLCQQSYLTHTSTHDRSLRLVVQVQGSDLAAQDTQAPLGVDAQTGKRAAVVAFLTA
jgi:hypothetical protein